MTKTPTTAKAGAAKKIATDERARVTDSIEKLTAYMAGPSYEALPDEDKAHCANQITALQKYAATLDQILAFEPSLV